MGRAVAVRPPVAHMPGTWRLIYFNAPNRGEQIRLLFHIAGVAFHDVRITPYPQGLDPYKVAVMGEASPLCGTDKCPAVTTPDGTHVVETSDIMRFVGQRVGLAPPDGSVQDAKAMEMCLVAQKVINDVFYGLFMRAVVKHIAGMEFFGLLGSVLPRLLCGAEGPALVKPTQVLTESLAAAEACLASSGGPFVLGAELSYADVSLFDAIEKAFQFDFAFDKAALLAAHPHVATMYSRVEELAGGWLQARVTKHMVGKSTIAAFVAVTNTPFFWSKVQGPKETIDEAVPGRQ